MNPLFGILGIVAILAVAFLLSTNRKAIRPRVVGAAFALQALIAWLVLWTPWGREGIQGLSNGVAALLGYATKGTEFLFGPSASNPLANTFALAALPAPRAFKTAVPRCATVVTKSVFNQFSSLMISVTGLLLIFAL